MNLCNLKNLIYKRIRINEKFKVDKIFHLKNTLDFWREVKILKNVNRFNNILKYK